MPLYHADINRLITFYYDNVSKVIDELGAIANQNMKDMGGIDIWTFNADCEETGKTPKDYHLLIILSQPKKMEEDEAIRALFEYSAAQGIVIWTVSDNMTSDNAFVFNKPFEGVQNPIKFVDGKWCKQSTENYIYAINNTKTASLLWKDFIAGVIPDEKYWTGSGNEFIELYPGYLNGDPTSFKPYTVGNEGNVHILAVGGTGAGKSVFLNHLIACSTRLYDPTEMELWMADFKGVEFNFYLPSEQYPFMLPHIKACLCTSDPDFATSLFKAVRNMADKRYEDMLAIGVKNMPGWNAYWKRKAEEENNPKLYQENKWPRVLFICDEFQVIFEKADPKSLESINEDITQLAKVARAAGVHIFFTSQSMKKTISDDILQQFSLRFALRCDKEVSMAVMGTPFAGEITEKNGYLYVRSVEMKLEDQKRYRTPFAADDILREHIKGTYDNALKWESEGKFKFRDVISYLESDRHPIEDVDKWFSNEEVMKKLPESGVFFLGMRMAYTANKAPDNIILDNKNNTHIFSIFRDYTDFVLFFNTIVHNIALNKNPGTVIINSQVEDLSYITDAEKYITREADKPKLSNKYSCSEMVSWIKGLLKSKQAKGQKDKPVWIILLGWDKGNGFGVDSDMSMVSDFGVLLQTCGEFNIHIIFICSGLGQIRRAIYEACTYKIAGKCTEDESMTIITTKQASRLYPSMKTGWMFKYVDGSITRDKLWISPVEREIQANEIVI